MLINGTLGTVTKLHEGSVRVRADGAGNEVVLTETTWEKYRYTLQDTQFLPEIVRLYRQIPLTHRWAITLHKARASPSTLCAWIVESEPLPLVKPMGALSRTRNIDAASSTHSTAFTEAITPR